MDISLINAGLAGGAALASVPVILHLFMKQTPKRVVFPALRLIRERHKRSRKKLRIKNWLLLLARMALVALMALALARPRLFSQTSLGDQEVPTAVGLVFDTSLSMGYKPRDKTLLDEAKERANDILKRLPSSSQVFVVDSADPGVANALSPTAARKRVEGLVIRPANRPLNAALGQAYAAVADCDRPRHEVFVLTDLARSSWDRDHPVEGLAKAKKKKPDIVTYVLRMAPNDVRDAAVAEASPAVAVANPGEPVEIRARFTSMGPAVMQRKAEFYLDGVLRGQKSVSLKPNGDTEVKFMTPKLDPAEPIHRGVVKLGGAPDPLAFDDTRGFTFKVQPLMKVLVISDLALDAQFVALALDPNPASLPPGAPRPCRVEAIRTPKFADIPREALSDYSGIFLLNVKALSETDWGRLNAYVHDGGGLVVGLGHLCDRDNYNQPSASELLPASLEEPAPRAETTFGKVADVTHSLFRLYTRSLEEMLTGTPVYRHWKVTQPKGSRTLLSFADGSPALIERSFQGVKTGRVLLWTTPLARVADDRSAAAWNEFPNVGWAFWFLVKQTVPYLAGTATEQLNYEVGQDVILPIDPTKRFNNYSVANDDGKPPERHSPPATSDSLVIVAPALGQWTVTASGPSGEKGQMGFSVNPPLSEIGYVALEPSELDVLFGKGQYSLAIDAVSLKKAVKDIRVGSELFPWIMALVLLVVTLENLLANKFHREGTPRTALAPAA